MAGSGSSIHVDAVPTAEHLSLSAPPDEDFNSERKTEIARRQLIDHRAGRQVKCARCRYVGELHGLYRCRWCGVWYCHTCAAFHFGGESELAEAQRVIAHLRGKVTSLQRGARISFGV